MWESPGYFNNRGIRDLARDKMGTRMSYDAGHSGWFETGGADFAGEDDALYNPATDTDSFSLNSAYDNAWPGTGTGMRDSNSLALEDDGYDGEWGLTAQQDEMSGTAVVSGADLAGFKAVTGGTMLAEVPRCEKCFAGEDCVAGCVSRKAVAKRRSRELEVAKADAAKEKGRVERTLERREERREQRERDDREVEAYERRERDLWEHKARAASSAKKQREARDAFSKLHRCEEAGLVCAKKGPRRMSSNGQFLLAAIEHLHPLSAPSMPSKLAREGVVLDRDPLVDEGDMPEQGGGRGSLAQNFFEFFDTGSKLKRSGIKVV